MTSDRTLWQRIVLADDELDQIALLQAVYDRVQDRVRHEMLIARMAVSLEFEFGKLVVNDCTHPAKATTVINQSEYRIECFACGANVCARIVEYSQNPRLISFHHSTPLRTMHLTSRPGTASFTIANNTWAEEREMKPLENFTVTVSGVILKTENEV